MREKAAPGGPGQHPRLLTAASPVSDARSVTEIRAESEPQPEALWPPAGPVQAPPPARQSAGRARHPCLISLPSPGRPGSSWSGSISCPSCAVPVTHASPAPSWPLRLLVPAGHTLSHSGQPGQGCRGAGAFWRGPSACYQLEKSQRLGNAERAVIVSTHGLPANLGRPWVREEAGLQHQLILLAWLCPRQGEREQGEGWALGQGTCARSGTHGHSFLDSLLSPPLDPPLSPPGPPLLSLPEPATARSPPPLAGSPRFSCSAPRLLPVFKGP